MQVLVINCVFNFLLYLYLKIHCNETSKYKFLKINIIKKHT